MKQCKVCLPTKGSVRANARRWQSPKFEEDTRTKTKRALCWDPIKIKKQMHRVMNIHSSCEYCQWFRTRLSRTIWMAEVFEGSGSEDPVNLYWLKTLKLETVFSTQFPRQHCGKSGSTAKRSVNMASPAVLGTHLSLLSIYTEHSDRYDYCFMAMYDLSVSVSFTWLKELNWQRSSRKRSPRSLK